MIFKVFGIALIIIGIIYLVKPDIFSKWIWKRINIAARALSPKEYKIHMVFLGIMWIVVGLIILFFAK